MDLRGAGGPKTFDRRYAGLTDERKAAYYHLRKELYYTPEEVDRLPWWQTRMFMEQALKASSPPEDQPTPENVEVLDDVTLLGIQPTLIS